MTTHRAKSGIAALAGAALLIAGGLVSNSAVAAGMRDPIQRQDLALIQTQLRQVDRVIDRLAARQRRTVGQHRRVVLDVTQLRSDIHKIRSGIKAYLAPPRLPPRHLAPLATTYDKRSPHGQP